MTVRIPTPLRSYTDRKSVVDAGGETIAELLVDLDRRYPGFRFRVIDEQGRVREHIKIFVNQESVDALDTRLRSDDEIHIICAISGGLQGM